MKKTIKQSQFIWYLITNMKIQFKNFHVGDQVAMMEDSEVARNLGDKWR